MAMTTAQRRQAAREWARKAFQEAGVTASFNLDELAAAVAGVDDFIDANAAALNAALPLPFRANATAAQKAMLFAYCLMKRAGLV